MKSLQVPARSHPGPGQWGDVGGGHTLDWCAGRDTTHREAVTSLALFLMSNIAMFSVVNTIDK